MSGNAEERDKGWKIKGDPKTLRDTRENEDNFAPDFGRSAEAGVRVEKTRERESILFKLHTRPSEERSDEVPYGAAGGRYEPFWNRNPCVRG